MNNIKLCNLLAVGMIVILFGGCAGLSQQYKASSEGMAINYVVNKEQFVDPKVNIIVVSTDERIDKEVIGEGAKPSVGKRFIGYLAFGVFFAAFPDQPTLQDQEDPIRIFKTAMTERLSRNGVLIANNKDSDSIIIDLFVRTFKLDFHFGNWLGEVAYVAKVRRNEGIICENTIYKKSKVFNLYGYGSGEKAINEAFNEAINEMDINSCFSKLSK